MTPAMRAELDRVLDVRERTIPSRVSRLIKVFASKPLTLEAALLAF